MAVIKQSLVLWKHWKNREIFPGKRAGLAKGMLAFGRFGQGRTPRIPSNEGVFVEKNRLEASQPFHFFSLAIPGREQQFQY